MTECYEFEGKNVERAVQKACETLNIPKESLAHEVLSFGSSGIFGLVGVRKARIRVCGPETAAGSEKIPCEADGNGRPRSGQEVASKSAQGEGTIGLAALGSELIQKIIGTMTTGTTINTVKGDGHLRYNIEGGNLGIMIGKRGQTLEAIHYLVEKIVNKNSQQRIRIDIDVGGYLDNRRKNLRQQALSMAKKARQTGKPATVGQMNAQDRRIIHLALKDDTNVRTQSVGEGYIRKLIIYPKRCASKGKLDSDGGKKHRSNAVERHSTSG